MGTPTTNTAYSEFETVCTYQYKQCLKTGQLRKSSRLNGPKCFEAFSCVQSLLVKDENLTHLANCHRFCKVQELINIAHDQQSGGEPVGKDCVEHDVVLKQAKKQKEAEGSTHIKGAKRPQV